MQPFVHLNFIYTPIPCVWWYTLKNTLRYCSMKFIRPYILLLLLDFVPICQQSIITKCNIDQYRTRQMRKKLFHIPFAKKKPHLSDIKAVGCVWQVMSQELCPFGSDTQRLAQKSIAINLTQPCFSMFIAVWTHLFSPCKLTQRQDG